MTKKNYILVFFISSFYVLILFAIKKFSAKYQLNKKETYSKIKTKKDKICDPKIVPLKSKDISIWDNLHLRNHESLLESIDYSFAAKLANSSERYALFNTREGSCLKGVRISLHQVIYDSFHSPLNLHALPYDKRKSNWTVTGSPGYSAANFLHWAKNNPINLCLNLNLADITKIKKEILSRGSIYVYKAGRCGFHKKFGHIEVLVNFDNKKFCSDHCRVKVTDCIPDLILAPVLSCDWQLLRNRSRNTYQGNIKKPKQIKLESWYGNKNK